MQQLNIIYKTALAVFKDKKLLMVRSAKNEEVFYTLGGKIEPGETDLDCLHREVKEEVNSRVVSSSLRFIKEFEAPAFGKPNTLINVKLYAGDLMDEPTPSSEIVEIQYFDSSVDPKRLTDLTFGMFDWLKANGYIN